MPRGKPAPGSSAMWYEDQPEAPAAQPIPPKDEKTEKDLPCGCSCQCNCRIPGRQYAQGRRTCGMCEEGIHGTGILRKRKPLDDVPATGGHGVPGGRRKK